MYNDSNPFTFGALALDEAFTDREDELKELAVDIRNGQDVLVLRPGDTGSPRSCSGPLRKRSRRACSSRTAT